MWLIKAKDHTIMNEQRVSKWQLKNGWTIPLKGHLPETQDGASLWLPSWAECYGVAMNHGKCLKISDFWMSRLNNQNQVSQERFGRLHTNPYHPQSSFDDTLKRATWEQPWQLCSTVSPCVSACSRCVYWHWHIFSGAGGMLVTQGKAVPAICQMLYLSLADTSLWTLQFRERESKSTEVCQMWA